MFKLSPFYTHLITMVVGVLIAVFCIRSCTRPVEVGKNVYLPNVIVERDTVEVPHYVSITKTLKVPVPYFIKKDSVIYDTTIVEQKVLAGIQKVLVHRGYKDSTEIEKGLIASYDAEVTGTLDKITLSVKDKRPTKVVKETITQLLDRPVPMPSTGVYAGIVGGIGIASPQLEVVTPKMAYSASYNIFSPDKTPLERVRVKVGFKLFDFKHRKVREYLRETY